VKKSCNSKWWYIFVIMNIVVCSTSSIKLRAVQHVFQSLTCQVISVNSDSEINEQAVGIAEIKAGAKNRLRNALTSINSKVDIVFSIQTGIELIDEKWFYFAFVIKHYPYVNRSFDIVSKKIEIPEKYVIAARNMNGGFKDNTVAKAMAESGDFPFLDHLNTHLYLDGKNYFDAIINAIYTLNCQIDDVR
jgi:non-canonical (house-cleaning) NTP pyrophosphatase